LLVSLICQKMWYNTTDMGNVKRKALLVFLIMLFAGVNFFSYGNFQAKADTAVEIQNKLDDLQKKQKAAEKELAAQQSSLYKNQAQISATRAVINQINTDIARKEMELSDLENRARINQTILAEYIRQIYYADQENDPLVKLALFDGNLNDMLANFDNSVSIKAKIIDSLQIINDAKIATAQTAANLADQQQGKRQVLKAQQVQQAQIQSDIQDTQDTLANIQKKFDQLQSDLNSLLGTSYNAQDIKDAVSFASDKTGVPKGFLVGVLKVETNLGANVGKGTYKKDMNPNQWSTFTAICKALNYDPNKRPVSRRICYNPKAKDHCGGWGGAMGVAQFIPTTWQAYSSQASSITGHSPANPWSLTDGVVAMALKLKRTPGVTSGKTSAYKQAACSYLGACSSSYINAVLYWADNYKQLLN